jgi:hypothetical protein
MHIAVRIFAVLAVLALAGCSTFTVRADLSTQVAGNWSQSLNGRDITDRPLASLSLAFEPQLTQTVSAALGVEHRSYPGTGADRGEERVFVGFTWRPFGREVPR